MRECGESAQSEAFCRDCKAILKVIHQTLPVYIEKKYLLKLAGTCHCPRYVHRYSEERRVRMRESGSEKSIVPNPQFATLASDEQIQRTIRALEFNNIKAFLAQNGREAKHKVLELLSPGAEVFTATSKTLENIGITDEIDRSGHYVSLRSKISRLDRNTQAGQIRLIASTPEYVVGSVHAVTEHGQVMIASASGSQLALYSSGAGTLIWVVGTQKIVSNLEEGFRRIEEYTYPLEDARMQEAHKLPTGVNKMLIVNKEGKPGRTTLIFVNEKLGF
jgi:L-lactate utilization protein LutC